MQREMRSFCTIKLFMKEFHSIGTFGAAFWARTHCNATKWLTSCLHLYSNAPTYIRLGTLYTCRHYGKRGGPIIGTGGKTDTGNTVMAYTERTF